MILHFPDLQVLRFALTTGEIPIKISTTPVRARLADDGVWVEPRKRIAGSVKTNLARLGVTSPREADTADMMTFTCWPQILPLQPDTELVVPTSQTAVLFDIPQSGQLADLACEILRLGNDRQSFRFVETDGDTKTLLRVYGPPYYSLLRALDQTVVTDAPVAFLERAPRIWVELGYNHPLIETLTAPEGHILLLRPPHAWQMLKEAAFQDIYEILDFPLPKDTVTWADQHLDQRLSVPLRIARGGASEPPELWVLRDRPMQQVEAFLRDANDALVQRLSFAVGEQGDEQVVIVRVRASRRSPPALVFEGLEYRPYLKLPNLFVPCGFAVQPPLRRDIIRRLLAEDAEQITWLRPGEEGTFTPECLPDKAFRPLTEWVDYVLTRGQVPLRAWVEATVFDFEGFVCKDDEKPRPKKKAADKGDSFEESDTEAALVPNVNFSIVKKKRSEDMDVEPLDQLPRLEPTELELRQRELEQQFLELEGPLDLPERQALWPELGTVYSAQEKSSDAAVCWSNALWDEPPPAAHWSRRWRAAETACFASQPLEATLDELLKNDSPSPASLRVMVTMVIDTAFDSEPSPAVTSRLGQIQTWLQPYEHLLPIRTVWLVAQSLYHLSGRDVLALARTRDRVLERLFQEGLTTDQDLPSFLRFTGGESSDRFRAFRDWLLELPNVVKHWLTKVNEAVTTTAAKETVAYANLILAFGYARLGESEHCRTLHQNAIDTLVHQNEVHTFLLEAFGYRIEQATKGTSLTGSLPENNLEYLEQIDRFERYAVDRLRQHSDILEPHEKIHPYRAWQGQYGDDLNRALALLPDILDKHNLEQKIHDLYQEHRNGSDSKQRQARILQTALELGPRIGERFSATQLEQVDQALKSCTELMDKAKLLENALFTAAHFDAVDYVQAFVSRFRSLLKEQSKEPDVAGLDSLAGQCFRGLRKLGLRDSIDKLLTEFHNTILQGKSLKKVSDSAEGPTRLQSLLHVAGGWFYFGLNEQAQSIIEAVRGLLFKSHLDRHDKRKLALGYVKTLGQAPPTIAMRGIDELFKKLDGIHDTFTTNKYYGLSQLDVIEAVVLAIVTEDFALGSQTRRWLDDEEFLVRQRIHRDVREAMREG